MISGGSQLMPPLVVRTNIAGPLKIGAALCADVVCGDIAFSMRRRSRAVMAPSRILSGFAAAAAPDCFPGGSVKSRILPQTA